MRCFHLMASLLLVSCSLGLQPQPLHAEPFEDSVSQALVEYRWFHAHPELSNQEAGTAEHLAQLLESYGMKVQRQVGGHGLLATLVGKRAASDAVVLYRADMDALPVTETTGLPFASTTPGVMHACGHDLHMAVAVGALSTLARTADQWAGTVLFVAQPAEEVGQGAERVLSDPAFERLVREVGTPRLALALHNSSDLPTGTLGLSPGYVTANVDSVDITLFGIGGHGARPHETVDPIVMASDLVLQLQTIVSRRMPPGTRAVVTVGSLQAGRKHNVIPPSAELLLTVRSYEDEVRRRLLEEIRHIAFGVAASHHAPRTPIVSVKKSFTPSGYNDPQWVARLRERFAAVLGEGVLRAAPPTLGGEDFARYARELGIAGVMWRLGAAPPEWFGPNGLVQSAEGRPGLHSDRWAPQAKEALSLGIRSVVHAVLAGLDPEAR